MLIMLVLKTANGGFCICRIKERLLDILAPMVQEKVQRQRFY
ncbi:MAG: hypothetical protein AB2421_15045 [Thermotaleaceae bacterium]